MTIARITISWPDDVNGVLKEIKRGKSKIYDTDTPGPMAIITSWLDSGDKRLIKCRQHDVFGLDIAMQNPDRMRVAQSLKQ